MNYLKIYKEKLIPNMKLEGLKDQRDKFEGRTHPESLAIYKAICERIEVLEAIETLKN